MIGFASHAERIGPSLYGTAPRPVGACDVTPAQNTIEAWDRAAYCWASARSWSWRSLVSQRAGLRSWCHGVPTQLRDERAVCRSLFPHWYSIGSTC